MNQTILTIQIEAPGLISAIEKLACAIAGHGANIGDPAPCAEKSMPAPISAAVPASVPAAAPRVPTTPAPSYTLEQLSKAGANLIRIDPSKLAQLTALLQQYGVQAVAQLPPEHYGAFATALRGLGADI